MPANEVVVNLIITKDVMQYFNAGYKYSKNHFPIYNIESFDMIRGMTADNVTIISICDPLTLLDFLGKRKYDDFIECIKMWIVFGAKIEKSLLNDLLFWYNMEYR